MKNITNKLTFTVLATLLFCSPANAMWRTAGQKLSRVATTAAQQARTALAGELSQTAGKALQGTTLQRGLTTAYRTQTTPMPELRPATLRMLGTTAQAVAAQPLQARFPLVLTLLLAPFTGNWPSPTPVTAPTPIMTTNEQLEKLKKELTVELLNSPEKLRELLNRLSSYRGEKFEFIAQFAADNFANLIKEALETLLQSNYGRVAGDLFIKPATENFSKTDPDVLDRIMVKSSGWDAAKAFTKPAAENFAKTDTKVLNRIMYYNATEAAKEFTKPAAENFSKTDTNVLARIIGYNAIEAAKAFTKPAAENFSKTDKDLLCQIMQYNSEAAKEFTKPAAGNFAKTDNKVLCQIIAGNPEAAEEFTKLAARNLLKIDLALLSALMEHNPAARKIFVRIALAQPGNAPVTFLKILIEENSNNKFLIEKIQNSLKAYLQDNLRKSITGELNEKLGLYEKFFGKLWPFELPDLTITQQHMRRVSSYSDTFLKDPAMKEMVDHIIETERYYQNNYYTILT